MNKKVETELKKAARWKDQASIDFLVEQGYLYKMPAHSLCDPGECFKCDFEGETLIRKIKWIVFYIKKGLKRWVCL